MSRANSHQTVGYQNGNFGNFPMACLCHRIALVLALLLWGSRSTSHGSSHPSLWRGIQHRRLAVVHDDITYAVNVWQGASAQELHGTASQQRPNVPTRIAVAHLVELFGHGEIASSLGDHRDALLHQEIWSSVRDNRFDALHIEFLFPPIAEVAVHSGLPRHPFKSIIDDSSLHIFIQPISDTIAFDPETTRRAMFRGQLSGWLRGRETIALQHLLDSAPDPVSIDTLIEAIWPEQYQKLLEEHRPDAEFAKLRKRALRVVSSLRLTLFPPAERKKGPHPIESVWDISRSFVEAYRWIPPTLRPDSFEHALLVDDMMQKIAIEQQPTPTDIEPVFVDLKSRRASAGAQGRQLLVSSLRLRLLMELAQSPGPTSKRKLMTAVYGEQWRGPGSTSDDKLMQLVHDLGRTLGEIPHQLQRYIVVNEGEDSIGLTNNVRVQR